MESKKESGSNLKLGRPIRDWIDGGNIFIYGKGKFPKDVIIDKENTTPYSHR